MMRLGYWAYRLFCMLRLLAEKLIARLPWFHRNPEIEDAPLAYEDFIFEYRRQVFFSEIVLFVVAALMVVLIEVVINRDQNMSMLTGLTSETPLMTTR
ncbi:MAG TPA: hypothetical protein PKM88_07620 [bacterium]|nr:hypothetical protein [bacterium]